MTALLSAPVSSTWSIGAPRLLAGLESHERLDLAGHAAVHGVRPGMDLGRLLELLDASGIAGRGGAGFPLATKLRSLDRGKRRVVVNASESEPASHKDRVLLRRTPHLVIDGALSVADSIGAERVTVAVHDAAAAASVRSAVAERRDAGRIEVSHTSERFVAGEARAVVRALTGGPALPPGRRDHLAGKGILLANAETFAQLAVLIRIGSRRFAETGIGPEPGTTLLTIGGAVSRPGVVEIPLGTPLGIVLTAAAAADPHVIVTGGYHGSWLAPLPDVGLSRAGLARAGGTLGAGVLLVLDHGTCALGELSAVTTWLAGESARQCGPCRFGLPALAADVRALTAGHSNALGNAFGHARTVDGRGACSHPDGTARFVSSGLHALQDEVDAHLRRGGCGRPVLGRLPIGGAS
jgi:NADH:ubiquinone oxidoreductase subunit F (NADH-binding)